MRLDGQHVAVRQAPPARRASRCRRASRRSRHSCQTTVWLARVDLEDPRAAAGRIAALIVEHHDMAVGQEVGVVLLHEQARQLPLDQLGLAGRSPPPCSCCATRPADRRPRTAGTGCPCRGSGSTSLRWVGSLCVDLGGRTIGHPKAPGRCAKRLEDRDLVEHLAVGRDLEHLVLVVPGLEAAHAGNAIRPVVVRRHPDGTVVLDGDRRGGCCGPASRRPCCPCRASPARCRTGSCCPGN